MRNSAVCTLVFLALGLALVSSTPAAAQEKSSYVVIVHPDNPAQSLSKKKVSRMLLKELSKWDSGLEVQPVDLDSKSTVRAEFTREVHGRSVSSIKSYWQRQILSGDPVPPPELENDADVVSYVKSNPGAIGYVSAKTRLDSVKVLNLASK